MLKAVFALFLSNYHLKLIVADQIGFIVYETKVMNF